MDNRQVWKIHKKAAVETLPLFVFGNYIL